MATLMSTLGYLGTVIVVVAYAPQIWHLWREHCSAVIMVLARRFRDQVCAMHGAAVPRHRLTAAAPTGDARGVVDDALAPLGLRRTVAAATPRTSRPCRSCRGARA